MRDYLTAIRQLRETLESYGYYQHQISDIIADCIGHTKTEDLSETEAMEIISCLKNYIAFAQRCRQNRGIPRA